MNESLFRNGNITHKFHSYLFFPLPAYENDANDVFAFIWSSYVSYISIKSNQFLNDIQAERKFSIDEQVKSTLYTSEVWLFQCFIHYFVLDLWKMHFLAALAIFSVLATAGKFSFRPSSLCKECCFELFRGIIQIIEKFVFFFSNSHIAQSPTPVVLSSKINYRTTSQFICLKKQVENTFYMSQQMKI